MSIGRVLESQPGAGDGLSLQQLGTFAALVTCLKKHISWHQVHTASSAPLNLPLHITLFCAEALGVQSAIISNVWDTLRDALWTPPPANFSDETSVLVRDGNLLNIFLTHGVKHELGMLYVIHKLPCIADHSIFVFRPLQHPSAHAHLS